MSNVQLNGRGHEPPMNDRGPAGVGPDPVVLFEFAQGAENVRPIQNFLEILRRRMWVIVVTMFLITGVVVGFNLAQAPVYEASIKVLVGQEQTDDAPINLEGDVSGLQQLTLTVAEAAHTIPIAEAVVRELNLRQSPRGMLEDLSVEPIASTQFIEISYTNSNPEQAQRVVEAVGNELSEQVSEVSPSANSVTATVWELAVEPDEPVSPNPIRNGFLAVMVGCMLGVGLAFLLESLDDDWRSPEEAEQIFGVPTFGVIPAFDSSKAKKNRVG